jgi:hypothetical protein
MAFQSVTLMHPPDDRGKFCHFGLRGARGCRVTLVFATPIFATPSEGYEPVYVWRQVDRGPAKDAPGCCIGKARAAVKYRAGRRARAQRPFVPFQ